LDFGIAKTTEAEQARERKLTSPGMAMGTPEYMAPEQAAGRSADARCDVYALGAILFEMLTGVPPYQGDNFMEILTKKATIDPVAPNTLRSELPAAVSAVVMSAMARNPDNRPQTMEAFEYELNKCLAGRGVAVAQILGMSSDANLVANLNPGLSGGTAPSSAQSYPRASSGPIVPAAATAVSAPAVARDPIAAMVVEPVRARTAADSDGKALLPAMPPGAVNNAAVATELISVPAMSPTAELIAAQRKSNFGTIVLALLLLGGAGALAFFAVGEWKAGRKSAAQAGAAASAAKVVTPAPAPSIVQEVAPVAVVKNDPPAVVGSGSAAGSGQMLATAPPVKPEVKSEVKTEPKNVAKKSAKALLAELDRLSRAGHMDEADKVFDEVAKMKGYAGAANYTYAFGLFQNNNYAGAARYAKAAALSGYDKGKAMALEGDAYKRQNDFRKAKTLYIGALGRITDTSTRTSLKRSIAACNAELKLPANNGIEGV
jgi:hypothetical protein